MTPSIRASLLVVAVLLIPFCPKITAAPLPDWLPPLAPSDADPAIPTLKQVLGYEWGCEITSHVEIERYLQALVGAASDRTKLVRYGASYENRGLYYLVVSSPANIKRLDQIQRDNLLLADPRATAPEQADALLGRSPAIVWLAYSIHGNECSPSDAALLTAYHLLADRRKQTQRWLEDLVIIFDPLQNPDGRERFVHHFRKQRGEFIESNPMGSEHTEPWPGGRTNHYLFDMNRDWFLQSQRETMGKVKAYLDWQPQIYVDAHEMGRNATYFFAPSTDPINPFVLAKQKEWLFRIGRHQAKRFDEFGFRYTSREMFDSFYPGYGSEWPKLRGGIGILWEQAGVRGLVIDRNDETKLPYHESVRHHYVSGLATIEVAADHHELLLRDFHEAHQRAIQLGHDGPVRHFFLVPEDRPHRTADLARKLADNGIEVQVVSQPVTVRARDIRGGPAKDRAIPSGSYHISVAQPGGRLARALLDLKVEMGEDFVRRQLRRNELFMPDEIYDVTAWSLPLAFGVTCLAVEEAVDVAGPSLAEHPAGQVVPDKPPKVAYLVRGTDGAMQALCAWLQKDVRVRVTDRATKLDGRHFDRGTLVIFVRENADNLQQTISEAARAFGLDAFSANTGFVDEGAHFGGPYVKWVRPPKILLPVDRPTSYRAGHTWHLFDQRLHYPTTRIAARNLARMSLDDFNVLVLPHGAYAESDGFDESLAEKIRRWVRQGGTLILVRGAAQWALGDSIRLLTTSRLQKPVEAQQTSGTRQQPDSEDEPTMVSPDAVPGVFLKASVFPEHWVTYGCRDEMDVFFTGNLILKPLRPTSGRNLVTFAAQETLLTSGFCWPKTLELLAETPYVTYQAQGNGHIIAFTDDPNYRAMYPELQRLFINAVLFGPGH